ncbi:hypothetical protein [Solirubrobacter soli]|uniref:hypothetical protein n=1 Tax=Solirubrobacter soli TaxID=363832 RepID=UPI0004036A5C|nr:hypothetical protein [Solirubrobacter soli]
MRLLPILASAFFLAAAAPAAADSIVYVKQGNLYLTTADGSAGYQLTTDGGYSSPSQAEDGTIGAVRNRQLVRLDRSGHVLSAVDAIGTDAPRSIGGPYEARLSPDGTRFAYYFYVQSSYDDLEHDIRWLNTGSYGTWSYADRFTSPATDSEFEMSFTQPEWITNDRLLGTQGMFMNMWTWKLGTGHGYTYPAAQWWFGLRDPVDEWGVAAYHWYDDPALSRDGSRIAMTDSGQQLVVATTNGPAYSGEPPYPEPDYVNPDSGFAEPTIVCRGPVGKTDNPTWAPSGGLLAYGAPDGVHVTNPDCTNDHLLIPGGGEPAFGPAGVSAPASAPSGGTGTGSATTGAGAAKVTLSRVSLHPRTFSKRRGTTLRFTLSAPAGVQLGGAVKRTLQGHAGLNSVKVRPRHGSRLTVSVGGGKAVTLAFRLRA